MYYISILGVVLIKLLISSLTSMLCSLPVEYSNVEPTTAVMSRWINESHERTFDHGGGGDGDLLKVEQKAS